jgi:DNA-directed RNA polymerase subunit RPC12/RpoP
MSFKCQNCGKDQLAGTKETKVVTEVRNVNYPAVKDSYGKVRIPTGFETVKEMVICPECSKLVYQQKVVGEKTLKGEFNEK